MSALQSKLLCTVHVDLAPPQIIGDTPNGTRQIVPVTGGTVKGSTINGVILAGGGDWLRIRPDGVFELDIRATFKLDDDSLAYAAYGGVIRIGQDEMRRIVEGEDVDPGEYYFRITPRFETGSAQYGWLNNVVTVGVGKMGPGVAWVEYSLFQIL